MFPACDLVIGDRSYSSWPLRGWLLFDAFGVPIRLHSARLYTDELPNLLRKFHPTRTMPTLRLPPGCGSVAGTRSRMFSFPRWRCEFLDTICRSDRPLRHMSQPTSPTRPSCVGAPRLWPRGQTSRFIAATGCSALGRNRQPEREICNLKHPLTISRLSRS